MYLVVFRNRKRVGMDEAAYAADADAMEQLARSQPGFISFKSYTAEDGETVSISEWADEASARDWRDNADHARVQGRGRMEYYQDYTLFACANPRVHRYERPSG